MAEELRGDGARRAARPAGGEPPRSTPGAARHRDAAEPEGTAEAFSLVAEARSHPGATLAFVACVIAGAILCGLYLPESIALPRRVLGGAVAGAFSWLLVMVGRIIGG